MAMYRARVITPWVPAWKDTRPRLKANRPQLLRDYTVLTSEDVTGQPTANITPSPNMYTLEIVADGAVIDAIDRDADYDVLWSEEITEDDI